MVYGLIQSYKKKKNRWELSTADVRCETYSTYYEVFYW